MAKSQKRPRGILTEADLQVASRLDRALDWARNVLWRRQVKPFYDKFWEDLVLEKAAGLTFTSLFATIAMTVVVAFMFDDFFDQNSDLLTKFFTFVFPSEAVTKGMITWINTYQASPGYIEPTSRAMKFVGLAFSLILVIRSLDKTFNQIWAGREVKRSFGQYVVMFIVILGLVPATFFLMPMLQKQVEDYEGVASYTLGFLPFLVGPCVFWMVYYMVPISEKRTSKHAFGALIGALFTFALFLGCREGFSRALNMWPNMYAQNRGTIIALKDGESPPPPASGDVDEYGGAAGAPEDAGAAANAADAAAANAEGKAPSSALSMEFFAILLMYSYVQWIIVLIGLQISLDFTIRFSGGLYGRDNELPDDLVAVAALHMMADAYWNPSEEQPPYITPEDLSKRGKVPIYQAEAVLKKLRKQNIVIPVEGVERRYQPTVHLYDMNVRDVIERSCGYTTDELERVVRRIRTPEIREQLVEFFERVHRHMDEFGELSFKDFPAVGAGVEHYQHIPAESTRAPVLNENGGESATLGIDERTAAGTEADRHEFAGAEEA